MMFSASITLASLVLASTLPSIRSTDSGGERVDPITSDTPHYRARFDDGRVEFTSRRIGRQPLRLRLESIRRGATTVLPRTSTDVPAIRDGENVVFRRGDVTERYELRGNHIEQSFVFAKRPRGTGDLVVRLEVDTELHAACGNKLRTLYFAANGTSGGVFVGNVIGIDADETQASGHMNFSGSHLELVLPHEYVENATYPLVLDPPIGTEFLVGHSQADDNADVAYDPDTQTYLVVYVSKQQNVTEVNAQRFKVTGEKVGNPLRISASKLSAHSPAVAANKLRKVFFIVFQQETIANPQIEARAVDAATGQLSRIRVLGRSEMPNRNPDIGSDAVGQSQNAVAVWTEQGVGLRARRLGIGPPTRTQPWQIAVDVLRTLATHSHASSQPKISQDFGIARRIAPFCVTWTESESLLRVQLVGAAAVPQSAPRFAPVAGGIVSGADVATIDGQSFTLIYTLRRRNQTRSRVHVLALKAPASTTAPPTTVEFGALANRSPVVTDTKSPAIARTGSDFVVSYQYDFPGGSGIAAHRLPQDSATPIGSTFFLGQGARNSSPAVTTGIASDGMIVWTSTSPKPATVIRAQRWQRATGGFASPVAPACAGGGTIEYVGPPAPGLNFRITLSDAAPSASVGVLTIGAGRLLPCGPCRLLTPIASIPLPLSQGRASLKGVLPQQMPINSSFDIQYAVLFTPASPCPSIPGLGMSNILRVHVRD